MGIWWSVRVWVWQNYQKTHTCGAGVCGVKSYCVHSVRVCQNWLHTNTLHIIKGPWLLVWKESQISLWEKFTCMQSSCNILLWYIFLHIQIHWEMYIRPSQQHQKILSQSYPSYNILLCHGLLNHLTASIVTLSFQKCAITIQLFFTENPDQIQIESCQKKILNQN